MLSVLLLLQPLIAPVPEPQTVHYVQIICINQHNIRTTTATGATFHSVFWTSFWSAHYVLGYGPIWQHRGWQRTHQVTHCGDGYATVKGTRLVIAPVVVFIVSEFDWEYAHRFWYVPLD